MGFFFSSCRCSLSFLLLWVFFQSVGVLCFYSCVKIRNVSFLDSVEVSLTLSVCSLSRLLIADMLDLSNPSCWRFLFEAPRIFALHAQSCLGVLLFLPVTILVSSECQCVSVFDFENVCLQDYSRTQNHICPCFITIFVDPFHLQQVLTV